MSAEPRAGVGQVPRIRKSLHVSRPWLTGPEARTTVFWPGSAGQVSLRVICPLVLVMTRFWGASAGNCGCTGGASTSSWPNWASTQLILVNNWKPLRFPLWLRRGLLLTSLAAAMGDFNDPHDLLSLFLKDSGQNLDALRRRGWLGNVQYRPFTADGPAREAPRDLRAVTVFELKDLVELADKRSKAVILMARQCGICARAHADALRALLRNPTLKVFSSLILDAATAKELLK